MVPAQHGWSDSLVAPTLLRHTKSETFLRRSVVEFEWHELTCDADCDRLLGKPSLAETRHPVVELPDGTRLFAPTLRELAEQARLDYSAPA